MVDATITASDFSPLTFPGTVASEYTSRPWRVYWPSTTKLERSGRPTIGVEVTPIQADSMAVNEQAGKALATPEVLPMIRSRLFELMKCSIEDGEPMPSMQSLEGLMGFIRQLADARMPLLTADDDGCYVATWRRGQHSMLSIRFLDAGKIEFAISKETRPGKIARDWGETDWKSFLDRTPLVREFAAGSS